MNTKKILGIIAVTLFVAMAFVGAGAAAADKIWVSDDGEAAYPGTSDDNPCSTLQFLIGYPIDHPGDADHTIYIVDDVTIPAGEALNLGSGAKLDFTYADSLTNSGSITVQNEEQLQKVLTYCGNQIYIPYLAAVAGTTAAGEFLITKPIEVTKKATITGVPNLTGDYPTFVTDGKLDGKPMFVLGNNSSWTTQHEIEVTFEDIDLYGNNTVTAGIWTDVLWIEDDVTLKVDDCDLDGLNVISVLASDGYYYPGGANSDITTLNDVTLTSHVDAATKSNAIVGISANTVNVDLTDTALNVTDGTTLAAKGKAPKADQYGIYIAPAVTNADVVLNDGVTFSEALDEATMGTDEYWYTRYYKALGTGETNTTNNINVEDDDSLISLLNGAFYIDDDAVYPTGHAVIDLNCNVDVNGTAALLPESVALTYGSTLNLNGYTLTIGTYGEMFTEPRYDYLKESDTIPYCIININNGGTLDVQGTLNSLGLIKNITTTTALGTTKTGTIKVSGMIDGGYEQVGTKDVKSKYGIILQDGKVSVTGSGKIVNTYVYNSVTVDPSCYVDVEVVDEDGDVTPFSGVTEFYIANDATIKRIKDADGTVTDKFYVTECYIIDEAAEKEVGGAGTFTIVPADPTLSKTFTYHVTIDDGTGAKDVTTSGSKLNLYNKTYVIDVYVEKGDVTSNTVFYYELNTVKNEKLTGGYTYSDSEGHSFNVPTNEELKWYLTADKAPAGTYYHKVTATQQYPQGYDQIIYVKPASLSYSEVSDSVIYYDKDTTGKYIYEPNYTTITLENDANFKPSLIFEKVGSEGVYQRFDDTGDIIYTKYAVDDDQITIYADESMKGTWNVYADFSKRVELPVSSNNPLVDDEENMSPKAGETDRIALIGTIKIAKDKEDNEAEMTVSTNEITDGKVFSFTITGEPGGQVYVKYYKDGKASSDAKYVYVDVPGETDDEPFVFVAGQDYEDDTSGKAYGVYKMPETKTMTIGIKANTKLLNDQVYHFEVYDNNCGSDKKGGVNNPLTFDLTVKGNTFTAQLDAKSYALGSNFTVSGTYSGEDFQPYVYVQGVNKDLIAPNYANITKNHENKDGAYWYTFDGSVLKNWNPGTYTVYVSQKKCYDVTNLDSMTTDYAQYKKGEVSKDDTKLKAIEDAKVLTLTLTKPLIEITDVTKEVEAGFNTSTNKGKYVTINITAEGADDISLYLVGQNKIFYIDGEESAAAHLIRNLDSDDDVYYLFLDNEELNPFWYDGIENEKSVTKVAQKLGLGDGFNGEDIDAEYPLYLILDNLDGTYTIYLHIQGATDYKLRTDAGNVPERYNNTYFDNGQYYIVAQHPMADKIYNTWGGVVVPYDADNYYGTGTEAYAYWILDKDVYYDGEINKGVDGTYYAMNYDEGYGVWIATSTDYDTQANIITTSGFDFNIPSVANNEAATKLLNLINDKGDASAGKDFWIVPKADVSESITSPNSTYSQGETITITVKDSDYDTLEGTLIANTFDLAAKNLNYKQDFAAKEEDDDGITNYTLTLDTTQVPVGDYNIVLSGTNDAKTSTVVKVYEVKVVAGKVTPVDTPTLNLTGSTAVKVGKTIALTAKMSDNSAGKFTWKSSDASVASVDENGTVTGLKEGTATITVTNTVNNLTASKTITVSKESSTGGDTPVTPTPQSPGFGILAALAGLGAVAALVLRRK